MLKTHYDAWPKRVPKTLSVPETTLFDNLMVTARRHPSKTCLYYYGTEMTYEKVLRETEALSAYLTQILHVRSGDRVVLFMQNSPQYLIAFYAILRARAVVVPVNPMNTKEELDFYIKDCESQVAIIGQELHKEINPLLKTTSLENIIVATYSDYISNKDDNLSNELNVQRESYKEKSHHIWTEIMGADLIVNSYKGQSDDMAVIPYTSGTTGVPKGCIHTNKTVQSNVASATYWLNTMSDSVHLSTLPLFHVTGMLHSMHAPIFAGASMVILTRWDRSLAAKSIEEYHCTHWINISTMVIDFLANPDLGDYDISSLFYIAGGGAPLPEAVGEKLHALTKLRFIEGYGLSETISHTHFNPPDRPKFQCLGIPAFNVDARIVDPITLKELAVHEVGEIIVRGPQVFKGYYQRPDETKQVFVEIEGQRFFRTGDIGRFDEEGYFFMVDRVKRMINASGFKVWPTEVENTLYKHPAILQACVVGIPDLKRGETVKAYIILNDKDTGKISEEEIVEWAKSQMAAYKYPRFVEFKESFPMTASGKILWRTLQEEAKDKKEAIK